MTLEENKLRFDLTFPQANAHQYTTPTHNHTHARAQTHKRTREGEEIHFLGRPEIFFTESFFFIITRLQGSPT